MFDTALLAHLHWPALALVPLLAWACVTDLRSRIISNRLNAGIALLAPLGWLLAELTLPQVGWRVGLALLLFTFYALAFRLGQMGGGDVKFGAALALWFAPGEMFDFVVITALAGAVVTVGTIGWHRATGRPGSPENPYGLAIAAGALAILAQRYLNQFAG